MNILIAAHNSIRKIEGVSDLKLLEKLDLSNNQVLCALLIPIELSLNRVTKDKEN